MTNATNYINTLNPKQVEQIQQSLNELRKEVRTGVDKLRKIESYLYDDDDTSSPGMVQKQREHEIRIKALETESVVKRKVWAAFGIVGGTLATLLFKLIEWILSNHKP